jgi:hypothetical protein
MASNETHNTDLAYADTLWKSADALRGRVNVRLHPCWHG